MKHLYETYLDGISAIAVTMPPLAVHPYKDHVPLRLVSVSVSTTSAKEGKLCSLPVESEAHSRS